MFDNNFKGCIDMSFLSILDNFFLGPVKMILEMILYWLNQLTKNIFISSVGLSVFLVYLVGVFYKGIHNFCEKLENKQNDCSKEHIEIKNISADIKRKNKWKNHYNKNKNVYLYLFSSLMYLILELLIFAASYLTFLNIALFQDFSIGSLKSLANPDAFITLFGKSFNLLPMFVLALGFVSTLIYTKGKDFKNKALMFINPVLITILIYRASSGFVIFWICYNIFLLLKTIAFKFKSSKKYIIYSYAVLGLILICFMAWKSELIVLSCLLFIEPFIYLLKIKAFSRTEKFKGVGKDLENKKIETPNLKQFIITSVFIATFLGVLIPSTYVATSPQEYINANLYFNPLIYVLSSSLISAGVFLFWLQILYWTSEAKTKALLEKVLFIVGIVMVVDYMFFGLNLGVISATLNYETGLVFSALEIIINLFVVVLICLICVFAYKKLKSFISFILVLIVVVFSSVSVMNIVNSADSIKKYKENDTMGTNVNFSVSTTGHNVIVIMLDRALGQYLPFIFNERPELEEKFDGFTHYKNTISFAVYTNIASPAMLGGYEYTPVELNKRDGESLMEKNNEANLVLPRLFSENGYKVSVSDPVYTNYQSYSDLSIFDDYEEINAFRSIGKFMDENQTRYMYKQNQTNFFRFSLMKTLPVFLQTIMYNSGNYNNFDRVSEVRTYNNQVVENISKASGIYSLFMSNYLTLTNLNTMTNVDSDDTNTFLFLRNDLTHEPMLLDEANGYTPSFEVDNTEYDKTHSDRFNLNGLELNISTLEQMKHYQANMAALIQIGNWLDYLREIGAYDNSRIIIVSDHGRFLESIDELIYQDIDLNGFAPLLLVKDFNETGFKYSEQFMTNADVATLATQNLGFEAKNPFTGKIISMDEKYAHSQYISLSLAWDISKNNGNTFKKSRWLKFDSLAQDCNIYNMNNWSVSDSSFVLKEHLF